jgi:DNA repair exonuclease SbcCD ATPase subunit
MRSEVEKDEQLHVGKILASAATAATGSLQDAFEAVTLLKTRFNELATAMPQFQKDLVAGNQQQLDYVRQFWSEIEQVRGGLKDILHDFDGVRDRLRNSKNEVTDLGSAIRKAAMDSTASMHEIATKSQHEMSAVSENAAALSEVSEYMLEMFKQGLVKALYDATQDIGVINAFMPTLNRELTTWREANLQMHQESLARHAENQAYLNQTAATLEQFNQAAYEMNATMASISSFVGIGWPGAVELLKTTAIFAAYTFVYALISYGLWEKYAGFYITGRLLASIATGFGESYAH